MGDERHPARARRTAPGLHAVPVTGAARDPYHDVAVEVLRHGPLPRGHLARRLGLSPGSLSRLSKPLVDSGLLVESAPTADPETRRPTRPLDVRADRFRFVGVDVCGDRAWGVATDLRAQVLARASRAVTDASPAGVTELVAALVRDLVGDPAGRSAGVDAVGVALGGPVTADGVVRRAPFLGWQEPVDLTSLLVDRLQRPVVVGNDLVALTRAEHWFGEGRGSTSFAVVTVGAGVGYGLVMHDQVVETPDTGLGLLGHHPLDSSGPRCPAGHRGCATALLTLPALAAAGTLALARPVTASEVLELAAGGEPRARLLVDDSARHLGTLVATVANTTGVRTVLVTGDGVEVARAGRAAMTAGIAAARDPLATPVRAVVQPHDFYAWSRGAAGIAIQTYVAGPGWPLLDAAG